MADTFLGHYNTICGRSLLYVVGAIILGAATFNYGAIYGLSTGTREAFLKIALLLIFIGTGGIKARSRMRGPSFS